MRRGHFAFVKYFITYNSIKCLNFTVGTIKICMNQNDKCIYFYKPEY